MKRSWAGEVRNVSLLVASAVNSEGFREILGICEGAKEDKSGWSAFLRHLVDRGGSNDCITSSPLPSCNCDVTVPFLLCGGFVCARWMMEQISISNYKTPSGRCADRTQYRGIDPNSLWRA
jgi:hypothetical protein